MTSISLGSLACLTSLAIAVTACAPSTAPDARAIPAPTSSASVEAPGAGTTPARIDGSASGSASPPGKRGIDPTEFDSTDLVVGSGTSAEIGSRISVRYVGTLLDGTVFDETGHRPFEFTLGQGEVIRGWDRGVVHMRVGGKRRLVVPSDLAYGARGSPPKIPPNATLVFEIELLDVQ